MELIVTKGYKSKTKIEKTRSVKKMKNLKTVNYEEKEMHDIMTEFYSNQKTNNKNFIDIHHV